MDYAIYTIIFSTTNPPPPHNKLQSFLTGVIVTKIGTCVVYEQTEYEIKQIIL